MFKVFILKHTHNAIFNVSKLFLSKLGGEYFYLLKGDKSKAAGKWEGVQQTSRFRPQGHLVEP